MTSLLYRRLDIRWPTREYPVGIGSPDAMSASTDPMDGMVEALSVSGDGGRSGLQGGQELAETDAIGSLDEDQAILQRMCFEIGEKLFDGGEDLGLAVRNLLPFWPAE